MVLRVSTARSDWRDHRSIQVSHSSGQGATSGRSLPGPARAELRSCWATTPNRLAQDSQPHEPGGDTRKHRNGRFRGLVSGEAGDAFIGQRSRSGAPCQTSSSATQRGIIRSSSVAIAQRQHRVPKPSIGLTHRVLPKQAKRQRRLITAAEQRMNRLARCNAVSSNGNERQSQFAVTAVRASDLPPLFDAPLFGRSPEKTAFPGNSAQHLIRVTPSE